MGKAGRFAPAAALVALAAVLFCSALQYGHNWSTTWSDGRVNQGRSDRPLIFTEISVADFAGGTGRRAVSASHEAGFYPRGGISPLLARIAGIFVPALLVIVAGAYAVHTRWAITLALILAAIVSFPTFITYGPQLVETHTGSSTLYEFLSNTPSQVPLLEGRREDDCGLPHLPSCDKPHDLWQWGYYPTDGVPHGIALVFGAISPVLMFAAAAFVGLDAIRRRWKIA